MLKRWLVAVAALVILAAGCASGNPTGDTDNVSPATGTSSVSSSAPDSPEAVTTPATTTTVAMATLSEFPLSDAERACVVDRLRVRADELAAIPAEELRPVVDECVRVETFGPALTEQLAADFPGIYSDEQLACIEAAYAALSGEDISALTTAGLNPLDDTLASVGAAVLSAVFEGCATVPPAEL